MEMKHLNEGGMDKVLFCRIKAVFEKKNMFYLKIKRKHNSCNVRKKYYCIEMNTAVLCSNRGIQPNTGFNPFFFNWVKSFCML